MHLYLIRHGQTPDNVHGELGTTVPGPVLTDLGLEQAAALPEALVAAGIGALSTSTMVRTQLTAAPLAASLGLVPTVRDGLREVEAGELELRSDQEAVASYLGTVLRWVDGDLDAHVPGAEDGHAFFARFDGAVDEVAAGGHDVVAVVSHGAAIRGWAGRRASNVDAEFVRAHQLANTGVVVLEGDPGEGWVLVEWAGEPVGGAALDDPGASDPTGEAV
ncbi:histidine phosphatase family protein [Frigoribacterium sp. ACAM 257]|uniref:histidine phosphatase family protein n=1 Tax=Frigoribacterium sp. ACAM 257 TaxID=2508998 RepID=UPI0011B96F17|nr:histidine phosphatase family protein [Frigoribacterium sp. ACAM 257]TWX40058.1 histidine phosphatase family protein [Frigoribacterium sp. ACAM 257]